MDKGLVVRFHGSRCTMVEEQTEKQRTQLNRCNYLSNGGDAP